MLAPGITALPVAGLDSLDTTTEAGVTGCSVVQSAVVGRTLADGNEDVIAYVELDPRQPAHREVLTALGAPKLIAAQPEQFAALEQAAREAGYSGWRHVVNLMKKEQQK